MALITELITELRINRLINRLKFSGNYVSQLLKH
jgi:hypothetical protein